MFSFLCLVSMSDSSHAITSDTDLDAPTLVPTFSTVEPECCLQFYQLGYSARGGPTFGIGLSLRLFKLSSNSSREWNGIDSTHIQSTFE